LSAEQDRLDTSRDSAAPWRRWGPYVAERAWGTVREDYSAAGKPWEYFTHDHARSRAYRWNEDGLAGICDRRQIVCFALALWNGADPILKERAFGLTGTEGNHGEDVKEYYFYLDNTPTHSYMKYLYKYPQGAFPYRQLVDENGRRGTDDPEYELLDTGIFDDDRYFDVFVEYAKAAPEDILCRMTIVNRSAGPAPIHVLPTVWFRNTWSWGREAGLTPPRLKAGPGGDGWCSIELDDRELGRRVLVAAGTPRLLFTENDTNATRLFGAAPSAGYYKDGINDFVVHGDETAVNPAREGTKASALYDATLAAGETLVIKLRLTDGAPVHGLGAGFDDVFASRMREADEFYSDIVPAALPPDERTIMRQALAGLLWSKQFYHYIVREWLQGDPASPPPPAQRLTGRNSSWPELSNADVISMPDKWEYPWYAAWDLGFHCVALALVDPDFAKEQLVLLLREWYMHPNGQLPAYEWAFDDVNPPVHAWAAWRVFKIEKKRRGIADRRFLERVFLKLMLNFTWWVNRKDTEGNNVFEGGFLGLDNIGVFDRSKPLPMGGYLEQSDGTSWMAMYTLNMLAIAEELACDDPAYEDIASKFWEHFLYIARAMNDIGHGGAGLWDEQDGFFYDVLHTPSGEHIQLRARSMVGLIPLFAVETLEPDMLERLPSFKGRLDWFIAHRPDLTSRVACMRTRGEGQRRLLSVVDRDRLTRVLKIMLDEAEFLSPYGIRALSRVHLEHPYVLQRGGLDYRVDYEPAESRSGLFGGNSNWRGPIWFPANYLIIESLQQFHHYFGDSFTVECPTGSGVKMTLDEVAAEISRRLTRIFLQDANGRRPVAGGIEKFQSDPLWHPYVLFHEYFHGDNGAGLGASHQTGWTALVSKLLQREGTRGARRRSAPSGRPATPRDGSA
jgi:hypothetical protein